MISASAKIWNSTALLVIHDRDTICPERVDRTLEAMGPVVFKTPVRVPQTNAFCERLIGTMCRESWTP